MKPYQTLLFLIAVGVLSALTAWVFPANGIVLFEGYTVRFAQLPNFENPPEEVKPIENVEEFLEVYEEEIDSTAIKDSLRQIEIQRRKELLKIQWPNNNRSSMFALFDKLNQIKETKKGKLRIMHYGDSQIEGDRITSVIRKEIQNAYGGYGPGLVPAVEGVPFAAIKQTQSENWNRHTLFGRIDTTINHKRYGPLFSFGTFTTVASDSLKQASAWVEFQPTGMSYSNTRKYDQATLFYGYATQPFVVKMVVNDSVIDTEILKADSNFQSTTWDFSPQKQKLKFEFYAKESPEIYAYSLESKSGVIVDNIGLRGSSGTLFKKGNRAQLRQFMQQQPVKLMILQFGGNSVPYIDSEEEATRYGRWFGAQIKLLKQLNPDCAFIIIGPSDMATKVNGTLTTYPFLEDVRDVLKEAAFANEAGYWDLYEVMGGKNSMISWVEGEKPLAGADYVHFNNKGTRKVAELFMKAFWNEQKEWESHQEKKN